MKLTDEQKAKLKQYWRDWEGYHYYHDQLLVQRLKELDPEFVEDLYKATEGSTFWYA